MYNTCRAAIAAALLGTSAFGQADVRLEGPVEYGVFVSQYENFQPGERVLTRSNQEIQRTEVVPATLGTKFGMRYTLAGKTEAEQPLTLLYFTPGVITPDGKRHDKFEVYQKLVPAAAQDVMAFEFTEHHEVVKGIWHFMVFQGDRKLAEQRFEVR
ncbi:DUF3859 domain-containing protein [Pseudomonas sp. TTU2014-080ASC]|uniref:DUF3859 domain-containing protein n=1 Tax=Pseudomonas sp. TTU2014-080ASC TaxID=1729724 RepID=UPI00071893D7|nr:DUF3859 domain-containing protein [Pseudomonas sp. TTU2014-080ASC]KRW59796.1 helicase [Pseudomonas sp. TTU2014-080ASC]